MAGDQIAIRAVFMRGGTSKALIFHDRDLPPDRAARDRIFLAAIGSPDRNGRQLDGMGGGISSLSKVCVIGPPSRRDADVDYTFAQIGVESAIVDYSGNCGNMSSAVGPFAVDEGLVKVDGPEAVVRIHNTNTRKLIVARFAVRDGRAMVAGDFTLPGVAGSGAPIRLDFLDPAGAGTAQLLPSGAVCDLLDVPDVGTVEVSMLDAATPCVFVAAATLGCCGNEMPEHLDRDSALLQRLEAIRLAASIRMGIARSRDEAAARPSIPKVAMVAPPQLARTLDGSTVDATDADLTVRMISIGRPHRAIPLTGAMCTAVASRIDGTIVNRVAVRGTAEQVRIAQPSGLTVVGAAVRCARDQWVVDYATVYRTARRLMEGVVYVPAA